MEDAGPGGCRGLEKVLLITNENNNKTSTNIKRQHSLRDFSWEERQVPYGGNPIRKQHSLRGSLDRSSILHSQQQDQRLSTSTLCRLKEGQRNTLKTSPMNSLSACSVELREISKAMDVSQLCLAKSPSSSKVLKEDNTASPGTPRLPRKLIPPPSQFQGLHQSRESIASTNSTSTLAMSVYDNKNQAMRPTCLKQPLCGQSNTSSSASLEKKVRYPRNIHVTKDFHPDEAILTQAQSEQSRLQLVESSNFILAQEQMDDMMTMNCSMSADQIGRIVGSLNRKESPLFQTRVNELKGMNKGRNTLNRCQRKGKLHVVAAPSTGYSLEATKISDNNIKLEQKTDSSRLIVVDDDDDDENCVLINEQNEQEQLARIEESGYQSRETDSLCSSNRSTDYEDGRVFPSHLVTTQNNNVERHKICNNRDSEPVNHKIKSRSKVVRRTHFENNRMTQLQHQHQQEEMESVPSESSMEETSSRDSSVQLPRTRIKAKRRESPTEVGSSNKRDVVDKLRNTPCGDHVTNTNSNHGYRNFHTK